MSRRRGSRRVALACVVTASVLGSAVLGPAARGAALAVVPTASPSSASVVRIPLPEDDGSLTPYTFRLAYPLMTMVYDTLLWRDVHGVPQPWLAQAIDVSADRLRVTAHIANGARWQDGPPVTSSDVAFTVAYMVSHPHPRFTGELGAVAGVDTPDPSTAVFRLRHPAPGFLDQPLADVPILPAHLWRSLAPGQTTPPGLAVGSGPYRLVAYSPTTGYRFTADPAYFRRAPAVATIEVPIVTDVEATFEALERARVDMIPVSLPDDARTRFQGTGIRVVTGTSYAGTTLLFNTRVPPFNNPDARRAVSEAVDPARIARTVGQATSADHGYIHPQSPWSDPAVLHTTDATAAHADLARLKLPPLQIVAPSDDPFKVDAARQVALQLDGAGAVADATVVSRDEAAHRTGEDGGVPTFQLAIGDIPPLVSYDPDFLRRLFGVTPGEPSFNYSGYRSAAFDGLVAAIGSTSDPAARHAAVDGALRILARDAPAVPLFFAEGAFAYRASAYTGWDFIKGAGILDKRSFVEPQRAPAQSGDSGIVATSPSGAPGWPPFAAAGLVVLVVVALVLRRRRA